MGAIPVLLVCGHTDTADLYKSALEYAGIAITVTPTPSEALGLLKEQHASAVVVLIGPADDPVTIGREFRQQPGSAAATLVALSSVQHRHEMLRDLLEHFDDEVMIPCTPDTLMARIAAITKHKHGRASA